MRNRDIRDMRNRDERDIRNSDTNIGGKKRSTWPPEQKTHQGGNTKHTCYSRHPPPSPTYQYYYSTSSNKGVSTNHAPKICKYRPPLLNPPTHHLKKSFLNQRTKPFSSASRPNHSPWLTAHVPRPPPPPPITPLPAAAAAAVAIMAASSTSAA